VTTTERSSQSQERSFLTTHRAGGLNYDLPPMKLFQKAKKLGVWNPSDIDLSQDIEDWRTLSPHERDILMRQTALFVAGEESVTVDLLPLIMVVAQEGRLEEEIFLTSFLWEEAKHVEAFDRWFKEVAVGHGDLSAYHSPSYKKIFYDELPAAMNRLKTDSSPQAQVRASATYNMIVEGVLAETGYYSSYLSLTRHNIMPGTQQIIAHLKRDESRHIAFAVYFLSRLMAEYGDVAWNAIDERMNELLEPAIGVVNEVFAAYSHLDHVPFDISQDEIQAYAMGQFQKRIDRVEKARTQTLAEIIEVANTTDDALA